MTKERKKEIGMLFQIGHGKNSSSKEHYTLLKLRQEKRGDALSIYLGTFTLGLDISYLKVRG